MFDMHRSYYAVSIDSVGRSKSGQEGDWLSHLDIFNFIFLHQTRGKKLHLILLLMLQRGLLDSLFTPRCSRRPAFLIQEIFGCILIAFWDQSTSKRVNSIKQSTDVMRVSLTLPSKTNPASGQMKRTK